VWTIDGHAARLKWLLQRQTYISVFQTEGLEPKNAPSSRDIISFRVQLVNTAVTGKVSQKGDRVFPTDSQEHISTSGVD